MEQVIYGRQMYIINGTSYSKEHYLIESGILYVRTATGLKAIKEV